MKAFAFRLDRVLQLRRSQLQAEESKLEQSSTASREIEACMERLAESIHQSRSSIQNRQFVQSAELVLLERFGRRVQRERTEWAAKLVEQQQAVENQRLVVVQARSKVRLLERLRENRKAEWQLEHDRELELLAQESFGARWLRTRQRSEQAAN